MNVIKLIEGKDTEEIEEIILSNILSEDFHIQVKELMGLSPAYFVPIIRTALEILLEELSVESEVVNYHIVLEKRGFEKIDLRDKYMNDDESVEKLRMLDKELAQRILNIGDVVNEFF